MTRAVETRTDIATAAELRRQAKWEPRRRTALRLLAVANALEDMSQAEAARAAGIERQALCDAVNPFIAEGFAGLVDRPPGRRPERLSEGEQVVLVYHILRGPDPDRGEPASWTLPDLCRFIEARFGTTMLPQSCRAWCAGWACRSRRPARFTRSAMPRLRQPSQKGAPRDSDERRQGASQPANPPLLHGRGPVGQKGRSGHRWWRRGQRPSGRCDGRFQSAYIFAAGEPQTGSAFGLVLPRVSTEAMSLFLAQFAATLEPDTPAVMVLDGAGWHIAKDLRVPDTVTLVRLPAYSPELNPVERIWLYLREHFLSARVFSDYEVILDACCSAWNALAAEPERIRSLANFPYIARVNA